MPDSRKKILSTKRLSNDQLQRLEKYFDVSHFDLIKVEPLQIGVSNEISSNVILTSYKAAQIAIGLLRDNAVNKKYYCVGHKTVEYLTDLKLELVHSELYSKDLANWIVENKQKETYSYLCSKQRLDELPMILANGGIQFEEIFTYKSQVSNWSVDASDMKDVDLIMWYSPLGVKALGNTKVSIESEEHFCIGATTTNALKEISEIESNTIYHPIVPSVDGMVEMIIKKNI